MKDKGFTLIEIIAVIIILGILMIITIPSISGFISDSRNQAYHSHEKSMEEAAKSYTIDCIKNNEQNCLIPREGEEITLLLSELEDKDFLDKLQDPAKQGTYCNPEESYVKIRKSDDVDFDYTACLYCGAYSTENSKCFKIEVTPTTIECGTDIIGAGESWTREARTVSINCVDSSNSCKQERFEKTFGTTMEYGNITIYDMNPAKGTKSCRVPVRIDLEKPTCSLDVTGDKRSSYYVDDVTVSMPSSNRKDNHSGVGAFGIGTSSNNSKYDNRETMTISDNGVTRVFGYIKDIVGNEGICSSSITKVGKYYIVYDKNTGSGTMADTECIFGENCKLRKNTFTKTGYHFNYWSLLANGNTAKHYSDEETVKNLTFSDKVRIYAIWEINQNTLVVNANSGTGGFTAKQNYNTTKEINVSRTGYTFTGWGATGTCGTYTNAARTTYTYPANRDTTCTLKANWNINTNSLVVDANGGTGGFTTTQNYNTTKEISVSKAHFVFDGWEATGTCGTYINAASTTYTFPPNKDTSCTLKAKWKAAPLATLTCSDKNYTGREQTGCSCTGGTVGGTYKATNAGTYTASCAADDSHTSPANKNWTINKVPATLSCSNKTYNGNEQTGCSCTGGTVGRTYKATNAGTYTASCTGDSNHTNPANKSWTIGKANSSITCKTLNYNGSSQNLVNTSSGCASFSNNTRANAGSQTVTCNGDDNHNNSTCTGTINKVAATCPTTSAYTGTYDGQAHSISISGGSGGTIQYSTNNSSWSTTNPTRTVVGSQTTYVKVVGDGNHNTVNCTARAITISKADATCPTTSAYTGTYDGKAHSISVSGGSGGTIQYSTNNSSWSTTNPSRTDAGSQTTYVKVVGDGNHNTVDCTARAITISKADATCPTTSAYTGTYDGKAHSISVSGGSGGTIQYSTNNSSWSTTNPSRTDAGSQTTYVKVVGDGNHNTVDCTARAITISKVDATCPTTKAYTGTYDGQAHSISVSGGSGGTIQYSTNNSSWSTTNPSRTDAGSQTTYVKVVGDGNHNTVDCTARKITISKVNATCPTTSAYTGTYDGRAHSISVSGGSGGTIKYSTNNSSWSTTNPTRTAVGSQTTYVKVVGDGNHNTVNCTARNITINSADHWSYVWCTGIYGVQLSTSGSPCPSDNDSGGFDDYSKCVNGDKTSGAWVTQKNGCKYLCEHYAGPNSGVTVKDWECAASWDGGAPSGSGQYCWCKW